MQLDNEHNGAHLRAADDGNNVGSGPSAGEIMAVTTGLGVGYGANAVLSGVGGTAGLEAATWIPVAGAAGTGVGAAAAAGWGVGQLLNSTNWFKGVVTTAIDNLIANDNAIPAGELPAHFIFYSPPANGVGPWVIKPVEDVGTAIRNLDFKEVYFSSPYEGKLTDLYHHPFNAIDSLFDISPIGGGGGHNNDVIFYVLA